MIMWGIPVLGCSLLVSAFLLRRRALTALAVLLGGSVAPKLRELTGITDREREVLRLVGLGMSNAEIAAALYITVGTAKTHVARLLAKLGARDRVQLVITAYEAGLISASR